MLWRLLLLVVSLVEEETLAATLGAMELEMEFRLEEMEFCFESPGKEKLKEELSVESRLRLRACWWGYVYEFCVW